MILCYSRKGAKAQNKLGKGFLCAFAPLRETALLCFNEGVISI